MPIVTNSRSLSSLEAENLLGDQKKAFIPLLNSLTRSPTCLVPGGGAQHGKLPSPSTAAVNPELLAEYNRILQSKNIHEILRELLVKKQRLDSECNSTALNYTKASDDPSKCSSSSSTDGKVMNIKQEKVQAVMHESDSTVNTIPAFLQYIEKELEKLPYEAQERAKIEIFRVISELKKQSLYMVPHHWQLPGKMP